MLGQVAISILDPDRARPGETRRSCTPSLLPNGKAATLATTYVRQARVFATTVVHVTKKGKQQREHLEEHKSFMTPHRTYEDSETELRVALAAACY